MKPDQHYSQLNIRAHHRNLGLTARELLCRALQTHNIGISAAHVDVTTDGNLKLTLTPYEANRLTNLLEEPQR